MEPSMRMEKQIRKAAASVAESIRTGEAAKALYMLDLLVEMACNTPQERWQPWSYYLPRVEGEFG